MRGTVKKWMDDKGFGFITPEGATNGKDIFVHHSEILMQGRKSLTEGAAVEFDVQQADRGPRAVGVKVIG